MNTICNLCAHQRESKHNGGVECGAAHYASGEPGYGSFKSGAACMYDSDLAPRFEPRTETCVNVVVMAAKMQAMSDDLMRARDKISVLSDRLTEIKS